MLSSLSPSKLWKNFDLICSIPHPSKHEEKLCKAIVEFAQNLNLETRQDSVGNIIIKKPATPGFENRTPIILQAHIDMVPQKNAATSHNFITDPIKPIIDGEWVKATQTTLGADNGIGAASIMAILESNDIEHGAIEALFTIDEETGMTGAFGLEKNSLEGKILINTDTEDDRELIIGCAGGVEASITIPIPRMKATPNSKFYTISVSGLRGGHSGIDINLGRANANLLIAQLIKLLMMELNCGLADISGGNMRNAIPREAHATIAIHPDQKILLDNISQNYFQTQNSIFANTENKIEYTITESKSSDIMYADIARFTISKIVAIPNGVVAYEKQIPDVVETSSNLSIITSKENTIEIVCLLRSSNNDAKKELSEQFKDHFLPTNAHITFSGNYPGWKPSASSNILEIFKSRYEVVFGIKPEVKVVHAGLECGIIGSIFPQLDMISFGPTIKFPHSPDEKVQINSVQKYWNLLTDIIKNIP